MSALRFLGLLILASCGGAGAVTQTTAPSDPPSGAVASPVPPTPTKPAEIPLPPSGARLGAIPYEGGVEVRVWAPNAKAAKVTGDFGTVVLAEEPGGLFGAKIPGARAGQKYRFVLTTNDGKEIERLDPRAREVDGADAVVVDPRSYAWKPFTPPAREKTIVYEMHVGAFSPGGTFASAEGKLDALVDLGVNAIELMPINLHGDHGWGYGPRGWFAPHPQFGTGEQLRHFVDAAHQKGIAVIADVVFNHYDGWKNAPLRCFDGACPGAYFFGEGPYATTPWGPRPDFSKKEVSDFFADAIFAWSTEFQLDGFRHDSVSNIRAIDGQGTVPGGVALLQRLNDVAAKARPGSLAIAEDLKGFAGITGTVASGGLGFATQWDGGFEWGITSNVASATPDLGAVGSAITGSFNADPFQRVLYVESHDTAGNSGARLPVKIDGKDPTGAVASRRALVAAGLLFTTPGVPMLFMGQEMLETKKFTDDAPPIDWSLIDSHAEFRAFYKDLIRLRRDSPALAAKNVSVTHSNGSGGNAVVAYRRWDKGGDDVMVIANFGSKAYTRYDIGVPQTGAWKVIDAADAKYGGPGGTTVSVSAEARDGLPAMASIALAAYDVVVLTR